MPKGAKNYEDGLDILDLQIIDLKKQNDLFYAKIQKKQDDLDKLNAEYQKLLTYKNEKTSLAKTDRPPETQEEDQNRKVIFFGVHSLVRLYLQWPILFHMRLVFYFFFFFICIYCQV